MADFYWDAKVNRYRTSKGTFLSNATVVKYRDNAADLAGKKVGSIVDRFNSGSLSTDGFKKEMRQLIKTSYGAEYVFGRGGLKHMTPADWGRLGSEVKRQYEFLDKFVTALPDLSAKEIAVRAKLYLSGSVQAHGRGLAEAWGVTPPGVPGDGTRCLGNCRCTIRFDIEDGNVVMYWEAQADPCPDCAARASAWNPYRFTHTHG